MQLTLEEVRRKKRMGKELTDEEYDVLDAYWKSAAGSVGKSSYLVDAPESPFADFIAEVREIRGADPERIPGTLYCSFCNKVVSRLEATTGKSTEIFINEDVIALDPAPDAEIVRNIIVKNQKVVACPNHALLIKPESTDFDWSLE